MELTLALVHHDLYRMNHGQASLVQQTQRMTPGMLSGSKKRPRWAVDWLKTGRAWQSCTRQ